MNKKKLSCALIGKPLGHSYSPKLHALLGDYEYRLVELEENEVGAFLESGCFDALNVTIPYKKTVIPYLTEISDEARRIGAVNTITRTERGLRGDNTDYYGFSYTLDNAGIVLKNKKVLILGSGGASMTARTVAACRKAREVVIISRTGENNYHNLDRHTDCEILINTTPVGMYPNAGFSPVSLDMFPKLEGVCDMIYNPDTTALMYEAGRRNIPAVGGISMLAAQAKYASELFTNRKINDSVIKSVIDKIRHDKMNILLVGMPGCGKTTVGRELAVLLKRDFVDTDELIVKKSGMTIPEIFARFGESRFRELEYEVIYEASQKSSLVIATGGGSVVREDNRPLLKQNSTVVFLKRPVSSLSTDGRPISQSHDLNELYTERLPLYREVCDAELEIKSSDPHENAVMILKKVGYL